MPPNEQSPPSLDAIREEIDQIDAQLHALIARRTDLASHVWSAKRTAHNTATAALSVLRPAREAAMLRALAARHAGAMPLATLWRIWRAFIIANIRVQAPFDVFVGGATTSGENWDLARSHFGFEARMEAMADLGAAIAAARAGAGVAVVPLVAAAEAGAWWREVGKGNLRIFAALPQIGPYREVPRAFAVGDVEIEPTAEDITLAMLAVRAGSVGDTITVDGQTHNVVYAIEAPGENSDTTIVALAGFVDGAASAPCTQVWAVDGTPVEAVVLGAYAAPVGEPDDD